MRPGGETGWLLCGASAASDSLSDRAGIRWVRHPIPHRTRARRCRRKRFCVGCLRNLGASMPPGQRRFTQSAQIVHSTFTAVLKSQHETTLRSAAMKRETDTTIGRRQLAAGSERRAHLWRRWRVPALFGLGVALALLTPVLGIGSYIASLLVAGAAVTVTALAPVPHGKAEKPPKRQRVTAILTAGRRRGEHPLPRPRKRHPNRRNPRTPRAGV